MMLTILCCSFAGRAAEKPNIVLILADDLGYETVGCYGGTSYRTPNLDRLAAEGIKFDRAYAMPLCTNTRVQLMTGKYNLRNWKAFGILDPKEKTFGHLLQQAGYKTCMAGKWQMTSYDPPDYPGAATRRNTGMHPSNAGFDQYSLWHVGHTETKGSRYADPVIEQNGELLSDTAGKYGPDLWTDFIGEFMQQNADEPFFVYYSMALPHNPMVPTPDSPEWSDPARRHSDETPFAADMIEYTDKMVGKVVAKLEQLRLREKTLILFYSDNGTNARVTSQFGGRIVRGEKGKGTELGIRVPAIANWRGHVPAGITSGDLIDSVDVFSTILDLAGADAFMEDPSDGQSFSMVLTQQSPSPREWVYVHHDPRPGWDKDPRELIRLALDKQYKLYEDGRLFDLQIDRFEETPLFVAADSSSTRAGRQKLQSVLDLHKLYPRFDPATVPRPNPSDAFQGYQFHDQGGLIVVEAEMLPIPRDESWTAESHSPEYLGTGYLRALRNQPDPPERGQTLIATNINSAGLWKIAIRCRSDHASGEHENQVWLRVADGPWLLGQIPAGNPGRWQWLSSFAAPGNNAQRPTELHFVEGGNNLWLAPCASNLKIDRIVLYQSDQQRRALDITTPVSDYHPWASP